MSTFSLCPRCEGSGRYTRLGFPEKDCAVCGGTGCIDANGEPPMSTFAEVMKTNPPRLVIQFQRGPNDEEQFTWGIVGAIPIMSLVGRITRIQIELSSDEDEKCCTSQQKHHCDQSALVIVYANAAFRWFVHPDIPIDSLVGMLEVAKTTLIGTQIAQMQQQAMKAQQSSLIGLDGKPLMNRLRGL